MRKFYCTLCPEGNTEVTFITRNNKIEVMFEKPVYEGFHTLVLSIDGDVLLVEGFSPSEIEFFQRFLKNNRNLIEQLSTEDT